MLLCKLSSMPRGGSPANASLAPDTEHKRSFPSAHCFPAPSHLAQVALPHAATCRPGTQRQGPTFRGHGRPGQGRRRGGDPDPLPIEPLSRHCWETESAKSQVAGAGLFSPPTPGGSRPPCHVRGRTAAVIHPSRRQGAALASGQPSPRSYLPRPAAPQSGIFLPPAPQVTGQSNSRQSRQQPAAACPAPNT